MICQKMAAYRVMLEVGLCLYLVEHAYIRIQIESTWVDYMMLLSPRRSFIPVHSRILSYTLCARSF